MSDTLPSPLESLPDVPAGQVHDLAKTINLEDPTLTVTYGTKTMEDIARFADSILARVRVKDAGPVGQTLSDLLVRVKDLDVDALGKGPGFLERLPVVGSLFNTVERSVARFKTMSDQVDALSNKLETAMVDLLRNIEVLEQLYEHNKAFYQDLSLFIAAGRERLARARAEDLPRLQKEAEEGQDNMAAQKVRDFADKLNRFERRLHDLQISRTITLQTAPQIRLIQGNDQTLAEKIQTSILSTIPIWKSQMVLALSLHGQSKAAQLQKEVADTTNDLLRKNADMLQSATVDTARQVERSVVDIETLKEVQGKLIATIEETLTIAREGRERRLTAERELAEMEQDLRLRLTSLATAKQEQVISAAEAAAQPALEATVTDSPPPGKDA